MLRPARSLIAPLLALLAGCALRPSAVADSDELVLIKSCRLPDRAWLPWYTRWAEHLWIDYKRDGSWHRLEWNQHVDVQHYEIGPDEAFGDERWERDVAVHDVVRGERARELALRLGPVGTEYPCEDHYRAWPGPNSNTFLEWLARDLDISTVLPPTAIGKDFTTWLHVGATTSGTGVEVETLPLGLQVGLLEGVEAHVLGLSLGVQVWPPGITLPFLPTIPGGWFAP